MAKPGKKASSIAQRIQETESVTHAIVVVRSENGEVNIGLAGPADTAESMLGILRAIDDHIQRVMVERGQDPSSRTAVATIGGHPFDPFSEGEN